MLVISTREFRDHTKSYFDQIDQGMEVLIQRGKNKSYKILPVEHFDEDKALLAIGKERKKSGGEHTGIDEFMSYMQQAL